MRQIYEPNLDAPKVVNLGGGIENSLSLKELSNWCEKRFGTNEIFPSHEQRPMDAPWIVMDSSVAQIPGIGNEQWESMRFSKKLQFRRRASSLLSLTT